MSRPDDLAFREALGTEVANVGETRPVVADEHDRVRRAVEHLARSAAHPAARIVALSAAVASESAVPSSRENDAIVLTRAVGAHLLVPDVVGDGLRGLVRADRPSRRRRPCGGGRRRRSRSSVENIGGYEWRARAVREDVRGASAVVDRRRGRMARGSDGPSAPAASSPGRASARPARSRGRRESGRRRRVSGTRPYRSIRIGNSDSATSTGMFAAVAHGLERPSLPSAVGRAPHVPTTSS